MPLIRVLAAFSILAAALPAAFSEFDRDTVVSGVAGVLEETCVDPKTGKELAEHLRRRQKEGAFDSCACAAEKGNRP